MIELDTTAQVRFVSNADEDSHLKVVEEVASDARSMIFCIAYLKLSGFRLFDNLLAALLQSEKDVTFYIGTSQYLTEPEALRGLLNAIQDNKQAKAYLVRNPKVTFHPKLYYSRKEHVAEVLIGSANITGGGLQANVEASLLATADLNSRFVKQIDSFVTTLQNESTTEPLNAISLGRYDVRYAIFSKHRRKAERIAVKETKAIFELDDERLHRYLKEYHANSAERVDRERRSHNYAEAKKVLDQIALLVKPTLTEFMDLYEQLVGSRSRDRMWHSGSLFRTKNKVATHRDRVVALINSLKQNIGASPEDIYSNALQQIDNIPGVGPNIVTEILNTYAPTQYAVLNMNPIDSLKTLGLIEFPSANSFKPNTYANYCNFLNQMAVSCKLPNLGDVDHFLNFVYWKYAKN